MQQQQLLPVWDDSQTFTKEAPETFDWLPRYQDTYENMREVLNKNPSFRDWLTCVKEVDYEAPELKGILSSLSPSHSGTSAWGLVLDYHTILRDWDGWVHSMKKMFAREIYDNTQLSLSEVNGLLYSLERTASASASAAETMKAVKAVRDSHIREGIARQKELEKKMFQDRLEVLEHHYKYPDRWTDCVQGSALCGDPSYVSEEHIHAMLDKYPDYRIHLTQVIRGLRDMRMKYKFN